MFTRETLPAQGVRGYVGRMETSPQRRRDPVQARSRARVDTILDAADAVFLELGFAEATTNHVAARAQTSIGSLYRFFPDKDALLVALAERYGARMQALASQLTPMDPEGATLRGLISDGIDGFSAFLLANPGFVTLIHQARHPALTAGRRAQEGQMAALIGGLSAKLAPQLSAEEVSVIGEVAQAVLSALQTLAHIHDGARSREATLAEAKLLMTLYLSRRLGVPEDVPLASLGGGDTGQRGA